MHLHEYQAKELLIKASIPTPPFFIASDLKTLEEEVEARQWEDIVVKIQVHAGGRGKAGGVKKIKKREIQKEAAPLLPFTLINEQTGPRGLVSNTLLVTKPLSIEQEYYLAVVVDKKKATFSLMASYQGGMDIEKTAIESPHDVVKLSLPNGKMRNYQRIQLAKAMRWEGKIKEEGLSIAQKLIDLAKQYDATLVEINPLIRTPEQKLWVLDAKMSVDDNALYRQLALKDMEDTTQISPLEVKAHALHLNYISLEGNIGCMVNGAGLAMATMDLIAASGGKPANFLDVGGSATEEQIEAGFALITQDPQVKAILVNIFGGIMHCKTIAQGILNAAQNIHLQIPLVVRLEGTGVEEARTLLKKASFSLTMVEDLTQAAEQIVKVVHGHTY